MSWRVSYSQGNWVVLLSDDVVVVLEPGAAEIPAALSDALAGVRGLNTLAAVSRKLLTWDTRLRCDLVAVLDPTDGIQLVVRGGLMVRDAETGAVVADGRVGVGWQQPSHLADQLHVEFEARENSVPVSPLPLGTTKAGAVRIDLRTGVTYTPSSFPTSLALAQGSVPNPTQPPSVSHGVGSQYQQQLVQSRGSLDERMSDVFANAATVVLPPQGRPPQGPPPQGRPPQGPPPQGPYPTPGAGPRPGGYGPASQPPRPPQPPPQGGPFGQPEFSGPVHPIMGPIVTPPNPGYQQATTLPAPVPDWLRDRNAPPPPPPGGPELSRPIQEFSQPIPAPQQYSQPIQLPPQEYSRPIPAPQQPQQPPQEYSQPMRPPQQEYSQPLQVPPPQYSQPIPAPRLGGQPGAGPGDPGWGATVPRPPSDHAPKSQEWETGFLPVTKLDAVKPPASGPTPTVGTGAVLSFSDGRVVPIDSKIIIGRAPKSDDPYVKTYKVASPNHDVSRSHMSIEPKGDGWLVSDLASTNGTLVRRPSAATVIAAEGSPVQVGLGTLISLGDGVVLRVDPA